MLDLRYWIYVNLTLISGNDFVIHYFALRFIFCH